MNPYEILMRGTAQFTGMVPGSSMSMPLNVRPDYIPGALVPSRGGALTPPQPSAMAPMGQGGAIVPYNRGALSKGSPLKTGGGLMGRAPLIELGLMGVDAIGQAVNPEFARKRGIQQQYQDATGDPGYALTTEEMQNRLNRGTDTDPLAMRARYGGSGDMDAGPGGPSTLGQYGPPTPTSEPQRGVFTKDGYNPNLTIDEYREQVTPTRPIPTRQNLQDRAYQEEASRLAQQADPFANVGFTNTGGGRPMLQYGADEGMAISRALYGDQLTPNTPNPLMAGLAYDETNPMMQGRNYNMENPVGVQQSSAQSLADYYRNGMMEQQTQGMGSEPGLESVLSPEDREMFLQQLSSFRPGGPG